MDNSLQADIALLEVHIKTLVNGEKLDNLQSYPHILLVELCRSIYLNDLQIAEITRVMEPIRIESAKQWEQTLKNRAKRNEE